MGKLLSFQTTGNIVHLNNDFTSKTLAGTTVEKGEQSSVCNIGEHWGVVLSRDKQTKTLKIALSSTPWGSISNDFNTIGSCKTSYLGTADVPIDSIHKTGPLVEHKITKKGKLSVVKCSL